MAWFFCCYFSFHIYLNMLSLCFSSHSKLNKCIFGPESAVQTICNSNCWIGFQD
uniref:Uncharacterized protein n=1 Tax=Anguilla anguilla TaxID=7936 RepID=A0A0E9WU46_ANGAN